MRSGLRLKKNKTKKKKRFGGLLNRLTYIMIIIILDKINLIYICVYMFSFRSNVRTLQTVFTNTRKEMRKYVTDLKNFIVEKGEV